PGVLRTPQTRTRAAFDEGPRAAPSLIGGRKHGGRILGVQHHVDEADVLADVVHPLPTCAAVAGLIEAAFFVALVESSECRDVGNVGILWMHDDAADVVGASQADV